MKRHNTIKYKQLSVYEPPVIYFTMVHLEQGIAAGSVITGPANVAPSNEIEDVKEEWFQDLPDNRDVSW